MIGYGFQKPTHSLITNYIWLIFRHCKPFWQRHGAKTHGRTQGAASTYRCRNMAGAAGVPVSGSVSGRQKLFRYETGPTKRCYCRRRRRACLHVPHRAANPRRIDGDATAGAAAGSAANAGSWSDSCTLEWRACTAAVGATRPFLFRVVPTRIRSFKTLARRTASVWRERQWCQQRQWS